MGTSVLNLTSAEVRFNMWWPLPSTTSLTSPSDITDLQGSEARDEPRDEEGSERKRRLSK